MASTLLILAVWRHRFALHGFRRPNNVRVVVVAPTQCILDETCADVVYQIEGPLTARDHNYSQLIQKVRELASNYGTATRRICVFERELQKAICKIRFDLDIEGLHPEQYEQLIHLKDLKVLTRRSGLTTARHCTLPTQSQPDSWVERTCSQVGGFPIFIKPLVTAKNCVHARHIARTEEELRSWARTRATNVNYNVEYMAEECLENGYEFTAVCSKLALIGTIATVDPHRTLFECVRDQTPYAFEYLSAEQTRDVFPGVESFVLQTMKSVFSRASSSLLFIKGFYKGHNSIYLIGASLEPKCETHAHLLHAAHNPLTWETMLLNSVLTNSQETQNGEGSNYGGRAALHHMVINFPMSEGVLLHQTSIARRDADIRVVWRASEGEELYDSDSLDDNTLQIFMSHHDRAQLLAEAAQLIARTDITVDRLCLIDKHNVCRRPNQLQPRHSTNQLIRSCTTAD